MKQIKTVIVETYLRQIKSWAFISMVLAPFLILGLSFFVGWMTSKSAAKDPIALVATPEIQQVVDRDDSFEHYTSLTQAQEAFEDKKLDGYIEISDENGQVVATYHGNDSLAQTKKTLLMQGLQLLQVQENQSQAQLSTSQQEILSKQADYKEVLKDESGDLKKAVQQLSFMAINFFVYFLLLIYSTMTAQEIAGEKGTKIMEVIFSSIEAKNYFFARIAGLFGVIVTHIGIYVLAALIAYPILIQQESVAPFREFIEMAIGQLNVLIVVFAIFALLLFVILSAFSGSLVTRAEDATKAAQPISYLTMALFFGTYAFTDSGDTIVLKVLSYFPLSSPFYMPVRLINGFASNLEAGLSLLILVLTCLGLIVYIGRRYAGLILQTDDIGLLKSLLRGLKRH
ncbi:ABC transporter permease [Streptococcus sp. DD13]|uniref:ABC transporter permease n=1 Tax=Streptococcus sp. DD13 TaxID=1777881 RepID=UPI00079BBE7A|nr:ABC transporter permease [Streptococcus sp. DD13]KXT79273.1 hypothetical protein STRDD13_00097 [Streptococcus sp. DD13]